MADFFDVANDQWGNLVLKVPFNAQDDLAEEMRRSDIRGVSLFGAIVILQERIAALESIPRVTEDGSAGGRVNTGHAPTAIKRMGRADRCRFGWRVNPRDGAKLLPDGEEQDTIRQARLLRSYGVSLREICRRLDQQGRGRRGKKWQNAHSVLREILRRDKQP